MSGDHGPHIVVPAALSILKEYQELALHIILVGKQDILEAIVKSHAGVLGERLSICSASEVVAMDEPPAQALRFKKNSSMRIAINLVKEGKADACVSAGNTGALMATARFVLKTWPGIDRPAISALLPTSKKNKTVRLLDLGANVDSSSEHLFQFAVMGTILAAAVTNIERPTLGLLNVGSEEIKGNEQVKETAKLLTDSPLINYVGYVEGDDIYKGTVDVIVCDGFVGNVALKTSEGLAKMLTQNIKTAFMENLYSKFVAFLAKPILKNMAKRFDPSHYNGASLVGLQGTVIKSHGSAGVTAFANAIKEAILEAQNNVSHKIGDEIARMIQELKTP